MTRTILGITAAVSVLLASAAPAFAQSGGLTALPPVELGANVARNPGFDPGASAGAGALPAVWTLRPEGPAWRLDSGRTGRGLRMTGGQDGVASAEQTVTLEPGFYTIQAWVKTDKLGVASERTGARLCLDGRPRVNWWKCTDVARGTHDWKEMSRAAIPVREAGTYRVTIGAYGKPDGTAWFDDVVIARVKMPPLDAFLLYPNYRGMLWEDRAQTIRMSLAVAPDAPRTAHTIRVSLLDDAGSTVRVKRDWPVSGARKERLVAELDAASLGAGEYLLRAELLDAAGAEVFRYPDHRVIKASAQARAKLNLWFDEHNVAHLGGKPAFVIGLYTTSGFSNNRAAYAAGAGGWGNDRIAEAPINVLINYHLGATPIPALHVYMDDLKARGIHYLQTVNFYYEDHPAYQKIPYDARTEGEDALNRWVAKTLAKHPGLGGFYTADERAAEMVPKVFRQHRELRRAAPGTVDYAVLGNGWESQAPLWRDAADVLGLDPYPITKAEGNHLAMVGEWTRIGQDAVLGSRPLWMVMQYFPLTRQGGWPTREQLRQMSWMSIVEGAKGLFYWSFGAKGLAWVKDPEEKLKRWQDLVAVTKEIKALEPALLAPDAAVTKDVAGGPIRTLGKKLGDGTRYLFAYNGSDAPATVRWTLAEPAREVTLLGEGKAPTLQGGALAETFAPYEVRLYRIR
jgi:hypothetical protein